MNEIPVNLPDGPPGFPTSGVPEFPRNPNLALMMEFRKQAQIIGEKMGLRFVGAGVGAGGADVQFDLGSQSLFVHISIKDN